MQQPCGFGQQDKRARGRAAVDVDRDVLRRDVGEVGERIGDEAAKIARMAKLINSVDRVQQPRYVEIRRMANLALEMLRKSLDCFARLDVSGSAEVVRTDQHVDDEFRAILRQLITFMMEDPRTISASIEILFIAKALERIGDHAKNISEYVIYMVKGKDVRHVTLEEIEREIMA